MTTTSLQKSFMTDKTAKVLTWIITVVVFGTVALLGSGWVPKPSVPEIVYKFPMCSAILNGTTSIILIFSFIAIKNKKIPIHRFLNYSAMILSALFLVFYIGTHFFIPDTRYGDTNHDGITDVAEKVAAGSTRFVYLFILITHIMLAAAVLPMVLLSFHYGRTNNVAKHRKLTRYSFPIWLYVTVTGVVVYLMIQPYYNF
jgi:putative membrane protein